MTKQFKLKFQLLCCVVVAQALPCSAQQFDDETSSASFSFQDESPETEWQLDAGISNSLQDLRAEIDQLRSRNPPEFEPGNLLTPPPARSGTELDFSDKVADIDRRINLLRTIYERKPDAPAGDSPEAAIEPESSTQLQSSLTGSGGPPGFNPEAAELPAFDQLLPPSSNYLNNPAGPEEPQMVLITGDRVLPQPVNVFEMGNSLLMTGSTASALRAYESVDRESLDTFDAIWLDFLIATCKRRTGDIDGAEALYREITNDKVVTGHPVDEAAWWLDRIEQSSTAKDKFTNLNTELDILLERANNHVGR